MCSFLFIVVVSLVSLTFTMKFKTGVEHIEQFGSLFVPDTYLSTPSTPNPRRDIHHTHVVHKSLSLKCIFETYRKQQLKFLDLSHSKNLKLHRNPNPLRSNVRYGWERSIITRYLMTARKVENSLPDSLHYLFHD